MSKPVPVPEGTNQFPRWTWNWCEWEMSSAESLLTSHMTEAEREALHRFVNRLADRMDAIEHRRFYPDDFEE